MGIWILMNIFVYTKCNWPQSNYFGFSDINQATVGSDDLRCLQQHGGCWSSRLHTFLGATRKHSHPVSQIRISLAFYVLVVPWSRPTVSQWHPFVEWWILIYYQTRALLRCRWLFGTCETDGSYIRVVLHFYRVKTQYHQEFLRNLTMVFCISLQHFLSTKVELLSATWGISSFLHLLFYYWTVTLFSRSICLLWQVHLI